MDIHQRSQKLRHLDPGMELNLGSSVFFPRARNPNNSDLSGAYDTCMYRDLSGKTNKRKTPIVNVFVLRMWLAKTRRPNADDAITRGGIRGLWNICGEDININLGSN